MAEPARVTTLAAIGVYNLVQNLVLPDRAYVPSNLAASYGLVVLAREQGCSWEDLGLTWPPTRAGLWPGVAAAAAAAAVAAAAGAHPATRRYLLDARAAGQRARDVLYRALVRFPLGTALFEEVAFRGVVYGVWQRSGGSKSGAALAAATTFGLWHLIPGGRALTGNPLSSRFFSRPRRAAVIAAEMVLTSLAGLGLTWMRERSGSLVSPWITHSAINSAGYLAGVAAWRRSAHRDPGVATVNDGATGDGALHG